MSRISLPSLLLLAACAPQPASGFGVRGHWIVEVLDAGGSTIQRREFDNEYVDYDNVLARILAGEVTPGPWGVQIFGNPAPCYSTGGVACTIAEPDVPVPDLPHVSKNLQVSADPNVVHLVGTVVTNNDGVVSEVGTAVTWCDGTVTTADCPTDPSWTPVPALTEHTFPAGQEIPVVNGQQVLVKVDLVFQPG